MKFELIEVSGMKGALLGMRLPLNKDLYGAKEKSDSFLCDDTCTVENCKKCRYFSDECEKMPFDSSLFVIGKSDEELCKKLINGDTASGHGQPNSKFLRMIHAQICVTAPLYFFKEMDTYKVGTTSNSTSTMHRLANYPITMDCFEMDDYSDVLVDDDGESVGVWSKTVWEHLIYHLEYLRQKYNETKDKRYWKELIRLLPESWLQTRMLDVDYQTLRNIYFWRKNHKLTEWHSFCDFIKTLPESWLITGEE